MAFIGTLDFTIFWQYFKVQVGYLFIFLKREFCIMFSCLIVLFAFNTASAAFLILYEFIVILELIHAETVLKLRVSQ